MSFKSDPGDGHAYNNADSFAMAFDDAWKNYSSNTSKKKENIEDKVEIILRTIKNHPFLEEFPEEAKQVAKFRLRLLNLN